MDNVLPEDFDSLEDDEKVAVLDELLDNLEDSPLQKRMIEELLKTYRD